MAPSKEAARRLPRPALVSFFVPAFVDGTEVAGARAAFAWSAAAAEDTAFGMGGVGTLMGPLPVADDGTNVFDAVSVAAALLAVDAAWTKLPEAAREVSKQWHEGLSARITANTILDETVNAFVVQATQQTGDAAPGVPAEQADTKPATEPVTQ